MSMLIDTKRGGIGTRIGIEEKPDIRLHTHTTWVQYTVDSERK